MSLFYDLSSEILKFVFSKLDHKSKLNLELVCKRFRAILNGKLSFPACSCHKIIVTESGLVRRKIEFAKIIGSKIKRIELNNKTNELSIRKLLESINGAAINLEFASDKYEIFNYIIAGGKIHRLCMLKTNLSLFSYQTLMKLENCKSLTELRIEHCTHTESVNDLSLLPLIRNGRFQHLSLNKCDYVSNLTLKNLAKYCASSLKTLELIKCKRINNSGIAGMLTELKNNVKSQPLLEVTLNCPSIHLKAVKALLLEKDFVCELKRRSGFTGAKLLVVSALNCFVCVIVE